MSSDAWYLVAVASAGIMLVAVCMWITKTVTSLRTDEYVTDE